MQYRRAGGQSTVRLWLKTSPQAETAFPVNREFLLNFLNSISLNSIIQDWGEARTPAACNLDLKCWGSQAHPSLQR